MGILQNIRLKKIVMYYSKIRSNVPASLKLRYRIIGVQGAGVGLECRGWQVGEGEGDTSMSSLACTDPWARQGFQSREELVKGILGFIHLSTPPYRLLILVSFSELEQPI